MKAPADRTVSSLFCITTPFPPSVLIKVVLVLAIMPMKALKQSSISIGSYDYESP